MMNQYDVRFWKAASSVGSQRAGKENMFRVYVGNLPYSVRDGDLKDFFEKAGCKVTEATVVMMPDGRSKGFGFVSFEDEASFKKAQGMSGGDMQGRQVRIDAARPKEDRGNGDFSPAPAKPAKPAATMDDDADDMMDEAEQQADDKDAESDDESDEDSDESEEQEDKEDK